MITLNFYKNGFEFEGHDEDLVCGVVSYATYTCISDCKVYDKNLVFYESGFDEDKKDDGSTYMVLTTDNEQVMREYWFFRENLINWCNKAYGDRVVINQFDELIELEFEEER